MSSRVLPTPQTPGPRFSSRLNILIVTDDFKPNHGEVGEYTHNLARQLIRFGDSVTVLASRAPGDGTFDQACEYEVLRVESTPSQHAFDTEVVTFLHEWGRKVDYVATATKADCILCTKGFPLGLYCSISAKRLFIPFLVTVHESDVRNLETLSLRPIQLDYALKKADVLVCVSNFVQSQVSEFGLGTDKTIVIPNGVDPQAFCPSDGGVRLRRHLGLNGQPAILTPGPLAEGKGMEREIVAFKKVLTGIPDAVYLIVGNHPYEKELRRQIDRHTDLREHIIFVEPASGHGRSDLYNASDVFAMPCPEMADGLGMSFLEANACGKPVVAGRSNYDREIVLEGHNGLLVDPWDSNDLAFVLMMLLMDREYASHLGKNGLRRVREEYDWEKLAMKIREEIVRVGKP